MFEPEKTRKKMTIDDEGAGHNVLFRFFTLRELQVVIAILAAMLIPALESAREQALSVFQVL